MSEAIVIRLSEALVIQLVGYAVKYGIPEVQALITAIKKPNYTLADIEAAFGQVKTYDQYNIPNLPPAPPNAGTPAA